MPKIYTKTGDKGQTGLYGGKRISKGDLRIEAYGTVDELNSYLGLVASFEIDGIDKEFLYKLQSDLFNIGSLLAATPGKDLKLPQVTSNDIVQLEKKIDLLQEELPQLKTFILPGGSPESSYVQIARTVCRRAERLVVQLHDLEKTEEEILTYLNRLSDFLFVLARFVIYRQGKQEIPWKPTL